MASVTSSMAIANRGAGRALAPEILREYDIRGEVSKNLNEEDAYIIGRAFAAYLREQLPNTAHPTLCVGYDGRLSSPALERALTRGLLDSGITVLSVGLGPTPMLYFAVKHLNADGGVMVTGSHNPPEYNGFKMTLRDHPVFGPAVQEIGRIAAAGDFFTAQGQTQTRDIRAAYVTRLLNDLTQTRPLTIAWDCGNGAAGDVLRRLTAHIPGRHILLHDEIDGRFPNHHPDPTVDSNLADLQRTVLKNRCDLGIAFDGDADRIGVVDETGAVIRCDTLLMIYAQEVLKHNPGATIIGDVKCSQTLFEEIARLGGKPVMWKTGHSVMKDKMRELGAPLAGELSGHIFFADRYYGFDDALYCAVRLLNALDGPLSSLTASYPKLFSTPEIRINVPEAEKFALIPRLAAEISDKGWGICTLDGLRVITPQGWFLLRASNTQNCLTARMESSNAEGLAALTKITDELLGKLGYSLPL